MNVPIISIYQSKAPLSDKKPYQQTKNSTIETYLELESEAKSTFNHL